MEFLGIGPSELLFILVIALILLGPRDMAKTGRMIGRWLRRIVASDGWKMYQQTSREIKALTDRLMREAQLEELKNLDKNFKQELKQTSDSVRSAVRPSQPALLGSANTIHPVPPPSEAPKPPSGDQGKQA
jgi:sec-independent protein translocase protein TatB